MEEGDNKVDAESNETKKSYAGIPEAEFVVIIIMKLFYDNS